MLNILTARLLAVRRYGIRLIAAILGSLLVAGLLVACGGAVTVVANCIPANINVGPGNAPNNAPFFQAVKLDGKGNSQLAVSLLGGGYMESGWRSAPPPGAGAYGVLQIQDPGVPGGPHPDITVAQAENPAYATNYMLPSYVKALSSASPALWAQDPARAMETVAFNAERPSGFPNSNPHYEATYREAYAQSVKVMKRIGIPTDFTAVTVADQKGSAPTDDPGIDCGNGAPVTPGNYDNPLRAVQGLVPERIDQGVDYSGTGSVYAIGDGVVTLVDHSCGWPGCNYTAYKLTDGPAQGKYVYVAEDCSPQVTIGQQVNSSTVLCTMYNGGNGMETGWSTPPGTVSIAVAHPQYAYDGLATAYGANFSKLLVSVGAPAGVQESSSIGGSLPPGWPNWKKA